jgi:hypothetical protein
MENGTYFSGNNSSMETLGGGAIEQSSGDSSSWAAEIVIATLDLNDYSSQSQASFSSPQSSNFHIPSSTNNVDGDLDR